MMRTDCDEMQKLRYEVVQKPAEMLMSPDKIDDRSFVDI